MARRRYTAGEIVNMMAVDVQRYMDVVQYVNYIWSAPYVVSLFWTFACLRLYIFVFQMCLCMYFLYQQLQASVFAGLGVMFLLVPFNFWISIKQRRLQFTQMKLKDSRIKLLNEILNGMKVS